MLYSGEVVRIKTMDYGSFCVADKIYDDWNKCTDADCGDCEAEYKAYTGWDSIEPEELIGHCYDYTFSADEITKSVRMTAGTFEEVLKVHFSFDDNADPDDAAAYVELMDKNSCIDAGPPSIDSNVELTTENGETIDIEDKYVNDVLDEIEESGATSAGAAASVALAAAAAMML